MNYEKPTDHRLILTTKSGNMIYVSSNKPFDADEIIRCISTGIIVKFPTSTTNTLIVNFEEVIVAEIQNLPEKA